VEPQRIARPGVDTSCRRRGAPGLLATSKAYGDAMSGQHGSPLDGAYHAKRSLLTACLLALTLLCACGLVWLAIWKLPQLLVDRSAYQLPNGKPNNSAIQDALNAVRVPIGVTAAAVLAASAAAAGVWINARTVSVARDSLGKRASPTTSVDVSGGRSNCTLDFRMQRSSWVIVRHRSGLPEFTRWLDWQTTGRISVNLA
jgi:hypothetical protein